MSRDLDIAFEDGRRAADPTYTCSTSEDASFFSRKPDLLHVRSLRANKQEEIRVQRKKHLPMPSPAKSQQWEFSGLLFIISSPMEFLLLLLCFKHSLFVVALASNVFFVSA
jgi:hypothetical protein